LAPPPAANATAKAKVLAQVKATGVPVFVNPESMIKADTQAQTDLGLHIEMGPDEVSFSQKDKKKKEVDISQQVALQLNGTPVLINPESMIKADTEAQTDLGLHIEMGPDEVSFSQKKATKNIDDKDMKGSLDQFNTKLAELHKKFKF